MVDEPIANDDDGLEFEMPADGYGGGAVRVVRRAEVESDVIARGVEVTTECWRGAGWSGDGQEGQSRDRGDDGGQTKVEWGVGA